MKNKLFKLLSALVAIVMVLSFSAVVLADESSESDTPVVTTGTESEAASETESAAESADASETESAAESADASEAASASDQEASGSVSSETSETGTSSSSGSGISHLPRWITLIVIVLLIVAAIIVSRTNTKLGQKLSKFIKDYKSEIKKISWSSWKDTVKATGVVLVFIIALAIVIGLLDLLFGKGIELLTSLFS